MDSKDVVEFKELLMANTIQIDTMYQLLILLSQIVINTIL